MRVWLLLMKCITCHSERDLVSALNARFRAGTPSDDPASAGVVVHSFDDRDKHLVSQLGFGESVWRSFFNSTSNTSRRKRQIVSCSIMNAQLPYFYRGEWRGAGGQSPGFVLRPSAVKRALLCSYPRDAGSNFALCPDNWRSSDTCVPGCPSARDKEKPGTARWLRARSMEQNAATLARLECSQNASKCKLAAWKNSSSTRPRLSLSQTMILHQRRMAGALSCTGHAVTCSRGARLVDHTKKSVLYVTAAVWTCGVCRSPAPLVFQ